MDMRDFPTKMLLFLFCSAAIILIIISAYVNSSTRDILINIAASFIFASVTIALYMIQDHIYKYQLVRFFGRELVNGTTHFAYPDFELHHDVQQILSTNNIDATYQKPLGPIFRTSHVHKFPVERAVATADIQALLYVTALFESTPESQNLFWDDGKMVNNCDTSFISFGLSSNDCTYLYLFRAASNALFSIVPDSNVSEHLRLSDGKEIISNGVLDYGIIVRHFPDLENHPNRRWFLIAGLGPTGTTGAAWFLSNRWRKLLKKVESAGDFCAVVKTPRQEYQTELVEIHRLDPKTGRVVILLP